MEKFIGINDGKYTLVSSIDELELFPCGYGKYFCEFSD